ncbi:MAG: hypothetical protein ACHREM_19960 [Polyangiales bacterium]
MSDDGAMKQSSRSGDDDAQTTHERRQQVTVDPSVVASVGLVGELPVSSSWVHEEPAKPTVVEPTTKGRYSSALEIGRGGMSIVQRVRDAWLLRDVAMKRLIPELAKSPSMVVGFVEEAQITGQLEHPNIVPVHELGSDANGTVFFTMKYVNGRSLHDGSKILHAP